MYCKNCGRQIENENNGLCNNCESILNTVIEDNKEILEGEVIDKNTKSNYNNYESTNNNINKTTISGNQKSKVAAGLLGIFFGGLGIHNFYLGYTSKAIAQLLISILSCGILSFISAIWGFIEGILILTGDIAIDAQGNSLKD